MTAIKSKVSLKEYNSFQLDYKANYLVEIKSVSDLINLIPTPYWQSQQRYILGGGSNILISNDFEGLVVVNRIMGIEIEREDEEHAIIKVGAGENWHEFVQYAVKKNLGGIENLSLIPGTVGAAPMQNIGAYGVELKDTFLSLKALNLSTKEIEEFDADSCEFGYRESIFKKSLKNKYFITEVRFKLSKKPTLTLDYGALRDVLNEHHIQDPTIKDVSDAVIKIRQSKLPDPKEIGNSGSFFKNPVIKKSHFDQISKKFKEIPSYPIDKDHVKVPAGWLIERCGWKGFREGNYGVHEKQALVLVNYGGASGEDIKQLAKKIQESVNEKFDIKLTPEVNYI